VRARTKDQDQLFVNQQLRYNNVSRPS